MEWLKQMNLKKSFFCLILIFLLIAIILSILVFLGCSKIQQTIAPAISIDIENNKLTSDLETDSNRSINTWYNVLNIIQIALPVIFIIVALLAADIVFYHIKLKQPLAILKNGAEKIMRNDLDFTIKKYSDDELGSLCTTFESMRCELLKSKKELWRQVEERKQLNVAFSHDLRNPITVLKGAIKILEKGFLNGKITAQNAQDNLNLIDKYIKRIEIYVKNMNTVQSLEDVQCVLESTNWNTFVEEFYESIHLLVEGTDIDVLINIEKENSIVWIDKAIILNVAENLITNAIRYTKTKIQIDFSLNKNEIILSIQDNGVGFPEKILKHGTEPFIRGEEINRHFEHFGLGLYICQLMCKKHGGVLELQNNFTGALCKAKFYICKKT
ncbi:HAMP domain-containing sensor histidine kinase [Clostridium sp. HBUAS56017]|uniref:HAMP domain-containing sensor histidine kinase n=1 Tax=Clostridium sp. HBUAS56017 TaxID=2571128 RepID=UPI001177A39E|nr:HAMP domain-containing sensor histidine kinase [Clostridium sp. HBUAS56017]